MLNIEIIRGTYLSYLKNNYSGFSNNMQDVYNEVYK